VSVEHEMERIGKIIAADNGIDVACRGVDAYCTEDRKVVIPSIETYAWLGADAERMLHGLLDHETGHALDTDFAWVKKSSEESPAFKVLMNALEDGYIEARQGMRYRGSAQNLARKNEWFWERGASEGQTTQKVLAKADRWSAFTLALTCVVRPYGGRKVSDIEPIRPDIAAMLRECESDWSEIVPLADQPRASGEVFKIAQRIYARFLSGSDPESKKDDESSGGLAPGAGAPDEIRLDRWTPPPKGEFALTPEAAISARIHQVFDRNTATQPYTNFDHSFDLERDFSTEDLRSASAAFEEMEHEVRLATDALALAFEAAVRARSSTRLVSGADEGLIDSSLLPSYAIGAERVDTIFQELTTDGDDRAVAVSILIDCSGSMNGPKSRLAAQAGLAMSRALSVVGIAHEVTGFTTVDSTIGSHPWVDSSNRSAVERNFREMRAALREAQKQGTDVGRFAREVYRDSEADLYVLEVPIHATFKSFASDDARGLTRVAGIAENLDGEAVIWAARRLAARHEQRRILFVLSDGFPAGSRDNAQGQRYLREVEKRVRDAGIEVYGFGIMSTAVQHFYPTHWVITDLNDLVREALTSLTEILTRNRTERACVVL